MRILLLNYETALGSAVHATPVFTAIEQLRPEWEVHVAAAGVAQSILRRNPAIHVFHRTPSPIHHPAWAAAAFARLGVGRRFDAVLINASNARGRIAWNARFVRAERRIGVGTSHRFVDTSLEGRKDKSMAANNLSMLRPLIPELDDNQFSEAFRVYFGPAERERASRWRERVAEDGRPLIGFVTQTSGGQPSRWFDERFVSVAKQLQALIGSRSVFFGTQQEAPLVELIRTQVGEGAMSLAGETTIDEMGAYCAACDLVVTLDTGTMHIGRAVGVPMVVIAPAWQMAHEWLPLGQERVKVLRRWDITCRHCYKFTCATHECMDEITVGDVVRAAIAQLQTFPPREEACQERLAHWTREM
jgi:ADP-heptose:LPS heptosyltransferase